MNDVKFHVPVEYRKGTQQLRQDEARVLASALRAIDLVDSYQPVAGANWLDYGCGSKLVQGLMQRDCPQTSYFGVDVDSSMIGFLTASNLGPAFGFYSADLYSPAYNRSGKHLISEITLPTPADKDIITMFSVATHLYPMDLFGTLRLLRRHAKADALLLFSYIPDERASFTDSAKRAPQAMVTYGEVLLDRLVEDAGWRVEAKCDKIPHTINNYYVCRAA